VTEKGYGIVVKSFRDIAPSVQNLLEPSTFDQFCRNASTYSNRALAEVPAILEKCVTAQNQIQPEIVSCGD
jgi:hypothetical protein